MTPSDSPTDPPATPPETSWSTGKRLAAAVAAIVLIGAFMLAGRELAAQVPRFAAYIASLGAIGSAVFVVGYALACVAFVPGSILTLAAGAIFGLAKGTALAFTGALLGATMAFLIARYAARGMVLARLSKQPRFAALDRAIGTQGRRIVFLLRLSPLFPFSLLNYALGLTGVTLVDYLVASVGMLPGTLLYVYYGRILGDVAAIAGRQQPAKGIAYYAVLAVGLVATIVVTTVISRAARSALKSATHEDTHEDTP